MTAIGHDDNDGPTYVSSHSRRTLKFPITAVGQSVDISLAISVLLLDQFVLDEGI